MLAEDFVPAGTAQTRKEIKAVAAAIPRFRAEPPDPPRCRTLLLSPSRPQTGRARHHAALTGHQRRWAESLPDGRFASVTSGHIIQAEQPAIVADRIKHLLDHVGRADIRSA